MKTTSEDRRMAWTLARRVVDENPGRFRMVPRNREVPGVIDARVTKRWVKVKGKTGFQEKRDGQWRSDGQVIQNLEICIRSAMDREGCEESDKMVRMVRSVLRRSALIIE